MIQIVGHIFKNEDIKRMFEGYIIPLNSFDIDFIDFEIRKFGLEDLLSKYNKRIDCTRYTGDFRPMQTIGMMYRNEISRLFYILENYAQDDDFAKTKVDSMCNIHKANLEFEKQYPPIDYDKRKKNVAKKTKTKEENDDTLEEKRLKLKINKLTKLKFKMS